MKRHRHDELLKEAFSDRELEALREVTLARGLAAQRSKRRMRNLRNGVMMTGPVLVLLVTVLFWRSSNPIPSQPITGAHPPAVASIPSLKIYPAVKATDAPPIPTISDSELLALYADRSVGLLGKPGQQKLVFFDQPVKAVN